MTPARPEQAEVLAAAVPFAVPLLVPFRRAQRRVGLLLPGPAGWGEFAPFDDYPPRLAARWLAAALEAAYEGWPAPVRASVAVNEIVPALAPDSSAFAELLRSFARGGGAPGSAAPEPPGAATPATIKVKVTGDTDCDAARVAAVRRAAGPMAAIRLDVNAAWSLPEALAALPVLAAAAGGLEYVEQPLSSLHEMAELRAATGIAVAVDESLRRAVDPFDPGLLAMVRASADVAVLKVAPLGGVRAVLRLAEALQMPIVISGAMDASPGLAAGIAAACALPGEPLACGLATGRLLAADVIPEPVVPQGGRLSPMIVTPDPNALQAARSRVTAAEEALLRSRLAAAWQYL